MDKLKERHNKFLKLDASLKTTHATRLAGEVRRFWYVSPPWHHLPKGLGSLNSSSPSKDDKKLLRATTKWLQLFQNKAIGAGVASALAWSILARLSALLTVCMIIRRAAIIPYFSATARDRITGGGARTVKVCLSLAMEKLGHVCMAVPMIPPEVGTTLSRLTRTELQDRIIGDGVINVRAFSGQEVLR